MRYLKEFNEYILEKSDPKVGTGKKPKGSSRRLYTDENPKDTVSVKFRTLEDIRSTINSTSFKSKSHKRQSQILNLIEQRVRVAHGRAKEPETKKRLKRAHDYIKSKCEASKEKTKRLNESHTDDIIENVKDILLPINDMGYHVSVTEDNEKKIQTLIIYIDSSLRRNSLFPLNITDELKEDFIRMKDYLQSEGYDSIIVSFLKCRSLKGKTEDEISLIRLSGRHVQSIEEKEFDDFINTNINYPIEKLRFLFYHT